MRAISSVVAAHLPRMLPATSATLYLPVTSREGHPPGSGLYTLAPSHPTIDSTSKGVLDSCQLTRRRGIRTFVREGCVSRVGDREQGILRGILRLELPGAVRKSEALEATAARDKILIWVGGTLAVAVDGAQEMAAMRKEVALETWMSGRHKKRVAFVRLLYRRCEGPGPAKGEEGVWGPKREALLQYEAEVDVRLFEGEVMGIMPVKTVQGSSKQEPRGTLLALVELAFAPSRLLPGALDALKPLANEVARHLDAVLQRRYLRQTSG